MHAFSSRLRLASVVALAVAGLAWTVAAHAGDTKFQATGTYAIVIDSIQGTHYDFTGSGHASPGGAFTLTAVAHENWGNYASTGTMTLDFGSGDTLAIYFDADSPALGLYIGSYVVTDGTGRWAGASGSGTATFQSHGDYTGDFWLDGTLSR